MSVIEYTTQINWSSVQKMKRSQLEENLIVMTDHSVALEKQVAEHAAALAAAKDDTHALVCQAVTLLNNGETLKASQLLRQWLMGWDNKEKPNA